MYATAKCSKCGKKLETDCEGCIREGQAPHMCKGKVSVIKVKWKVIPETEKEAKEFGIEMD